MSHEPYAADYLFASPAGPWIRCFFWVPTRLYDGRIAWLRSGWGQCMAVHTYLQNGGDSFWRYTTTTVDTGVKGNCPSGNMELKTSDHTTW